MSFISTALVLPHLGQRMVHLISPERFVILTGRAFPHTGQTSFASRLGVLLSVSIRPKDRKRFSISRNNYCAILRNLMQIRGMARKAEDFSGYVDPVFASVGATVYSNDLAKKIREENLQLKTQGRRIWNLIPQEGFQERVCVADADLLIIGGRKGSGKTFVSLFKALYYIFNPDVAMYAFRRLEDDVRRGPWKASKPIFRGFGTPKEASYEWSFLDGRGASLKMEHLQDLGKVSDRFRGAELAYLDIEELPEFTRNDIGIIQDFLSVNRNTAGVKSQMVATCNPVGRSNKLRAFLDWYIDPDTDTVIPGRDGKKRWLFFYGKDVTEIAWGNSWQEVYSHPKARQKIDLLLKGREDIGPEDLILTMQFIEGDYADNRILQITDRRYISRLASSGGESVVNDLQGIWRDMDSGTGLITAADMEAFFDNTERRDGTMRATADVALTGDFMVLFAFDGHHVCDMEAWRGAPTDEIPAFIDKFLRKNGVREENFSYDSNGLGLWLKDSFKRSFQFNNKSAPSDSKLWNNLKSESAEKFVKALKGKEFSISEEILRRRFTDRRGHSFTVRDRLMDERRAVKRKDSDEARFEIIAKKQMKLEIGHSPDFIEALFMVMPLFERRAGLVRKNFSFII